MHVQRHALYKILKSNVKLYNKSYDKWSNFWCIILDMLPVHLAEKFQLK